MTQKKRYRIILASGSPRRKELFTGLELSFDIIPMDIDETFRDKETPVQNARRLAVEKAYAAQQKIPKKSRLNTLIIAGDTLVVLGNRILGKPTSKKEAVEMLTQLSGRTHIVITALCLLAGKKEVIGHEVTRVTFRKLSRSMIMNYVKTGEPMDKAGAYGIQGKAALLVRKIEGDYFNVMGLPLVKLSDLIEQFGIRLL